MKASTCGIFIALVLVGTAHAGLLKGDPRVCSYGAARTCAEAAAMATAKQALARHDGVSQWYGALGCAAINGSVLRWSCHWFHVGSSGAINVTFARVNGIWVRHVLWSV
jgi:hypothetical protein